MDKSPDAFRTISEVAEWLGVQAHVLRFWESKFSQVKPVKRAGGRRYYRPADMMLLGGIKKLLHDDGLTVKGVQKTLREQGVDHVSDLSQELCDVAADAAQKMGVDAKVVPIKGKPVAEHIAEAAPAPQVAVQAQLDLPAEPTEPPANAAPAAPEPEPTPEVTPAPKMAPAPVVQPDPLAQPAPVAAPAAPEPKPAPEPIRAAKPAPEPVVAAEAEPEPQVKAAPAPPAEEQPILPSFLHRPVKSTPSEPTADTPPEPVADSPPEPAPPVPEAKPSLVVDAPDPPDEDDLPYTRGSLAHLSKIEALSGDNAAKIVPLARELQAWLDRHSGAGAS